MMVRESDSDGTSSLGGEGGDTSCDCRPELSGEYGVREGRERDSSETCAGMAQSRFVMGRRQEARGRRRLVAQGRGARKRV